MEMFIEEQDRPYYTENSDKYYFSRSDDQEFRKKRFGRCFNASDFIGKHCGFFDLKKILKEVDFQILSDAGSLPEETPLRVKLRPGKNADGW